MTEDDRWRQRVRLSECLIMDTVDCWCSQDGEFPVLQSVAGVLYIFSPRCEPLETQEANIRQRVFENADSPTTEYLQTWPHHNVSLASELIEAICKTINIAVCKWNEGSTLSPTITSVNAQIVDLIVDKKYVVLHHFQTTRRNFGL
jgi:hypothetical protein